MLVGDSLPVAAVARDSSGAMVRRARVRLACADSSICEVRNAWLHGLADGRTVLVASAGGWHADTLGVQIRNAAPRLVLDEDWEHGLGSARWLSFGNPAPIILSTKA